MDIVQANLDVGPLRIDANVAPYWADVHMWRDLSRRRVLFVGCGASVLPHFYSELGFSVDAVDVSPTAVTLAASAPSYEERRRFSAGGPPVAQAVAGAVGRSHEEPRFTVSDVFELNAHGEWDVIYATDFVGHFDVTDRDVIARRFMEALAPGGIVVIEDNDFSVIEEMSPSPTGIEHAFADAGFRVYLGKAHTWRQQQFTCRWWDVGARFKRVSPAHLDVIQAEFEKKAAVERREDLSAAQQGAYLAIFRYSR